MRGNVFIGYLRKPPVCPGGEAVCALGMPPRSSGFVCPDNQPWLEESFDAQCEPIVGEAKSIFKDSLD